MVVVVSKLRMACTVLFLFGTLAAATFIVASEVEAHAATQCRTVKTCHAALRWQKKSRHHTEHELAAARLHGLTIPYLARIVQVVYGVPAWQEIKVIGCESGGNTLSLNSIGAGGLLQFLASTWAGSAFGRAGFSRFDPLPAMLQAGRFVSSNHGRWTASGGWSASYSCHGLR